MPRPWADVPEAEAAKGKSTFTCLLYGYAFLGGQIVGYNLTDQTYAWRVRRGSTGEVVATGQADAHETFGTNIGTQADAYLLEAGGPAVVDAFYYPGTQDQRQQVVCAPVAPSRLPVP